VVFQDEATAVAIGYGLGDGEAETRAAGSAASFVGAEERVGQLH
jgi:hypothetical protein